MIHEHPSLPPRMVLPTDDQDQPRIPATCSRPCSECGLYDCGFDYCRCDQP